MVAARDRVPLHLCRAASFGEENLRFMGHCGREECDCGCARELPGTAVIHINVNQSDYARRSFVGGSGRAERGTCGTRDTGWSDQLRELCGSARSRCGPAAGGRPGVFDEA